MNAIWVGEIEGRPLVYDPAIQLPNCPHIFLWDPGNRAMEKYIADLTRELIRPHPDTTLATTHIESYKAWRGSYGESWLENESNYYESRSQRETADRLKHLEAERVQVEKRLEAEPVHVEDSEFQNLVAEIKLRGFTHSSQLSNYIVVNSLGYKYRNISGVLKMELDGTIWDFKGGFPPEVYARLCEELGLSSKGTRATPIAFESFDSIEERSRRK